MNKQNDKFDQQTINFFMKKILFNLVFKNNCIGSLTRSLSCLASPSMAMRRTCSCSARISTIRFRCRRG